MTMPSNETFHNTMNDVLLETPQHKPRPFIDLLVSIVIPSSYSHLWCMRGKEGGVSC